MTKPSQTSDLGRTPTKPTPTMNLPVALATVQELLVHLNGQFETLLWNVDTLLNYPEFAQLDTSHTKQLLSQLNECLDPGASNQELPSPGPNSERMTYAPTQKKMYIVLVMGMGTPGMDTDRCFCTHDHTHTLTHHTHTCLAGFGFDENHV